jgi:hypothetical protein
MNIFFRKEKRPKISGYGGIISATITGRRLTRPGNSVLIVVQFPSKPPSPVRFVFNAKSISGSPAPLKDGRISAGVAGKLLILSEATISGCLLFQVTLLPHVA